MKIIGIVFCLLVTSSCRKLPNPSTEIDVIIRKHAKYALEEWCIRRCYQVLNLPQLDLKNDDHFQCSMVEKKIVRIIRKLVSNEHIPSFLNDDKMCHSGTQKEVVHSTTVTGTQKPVVHSTTVAGTHKAVLVDSTMAAGTQKPVVHSTTVAGTHKAVLVDSIMVTGTRKAEVHSPAVVGIQKAVFQSDTEPYGVVTATHTQSQGSFPPSNNETGLYLGKGGSPDSYSIHVYYGLPLGGIIIIFVLYGVFLFIALWKNLMELAEIIN